MDFKLAQFSGKAEDFPAWITKFVAVMQTKGLFSAVMGKDDTPDELEQLVDGATTEQRSEHETKVAEREKIREADSGQSCGTAGQTPPGCNREDR